MLNRFFGFNLDFAGAVTAFICAIHCTILPISLSLGLSVGAHHDHTFDFFMMSIGVLIAGYVLVKDMIRNHGSFLPFLLALIGFVVLYIGIESHGTFFLLNIIGGTMIVLSHLLNWKLTHKYSIQRISQ